MKLSQAELENNLMQLGVQPGMALEVHCSLSSFGTLDGGAEALIEMLMRLVGSDGAIVMPSFRLSKDFPLTDEDRALGLTKKIRILDENEEESGMGIVSDTFRKRPDVVTGDGLFRVSAWGKDADKHSTGLAHLIENEGMALLLGVDIYRLSAMHYVEDALPEDIRERFKPSKESRSLYPGNQWFIEAWTPAGKPWYKIQEEAYKKGYISDGFIGNAKCMFFQVQPVIALYHRALLEDPYALYGLL